MSNMKQVIQELRECDHAFLSKEGVAKFATDFRVTLTPRRHHADPPGTLKGLTFKDGAKSAVGMDAAEMAQLICIQLGVDFDPKFGRGSQLRSCCDALAKHFGVEAE